MNEAFLYQRLQPMLQVQLLLQMLIRLDWNSNVKWKKEMRAHHDVSVDDVARGVVDHTQEAGHGGVGGKPRRGKGGGGGEQQLLAADGAVGLDPDHLNVFGI